MKFILTLILSIITIQSFSQNKMANDSRLISSLEIKNKLLEADSIKLSFEFKRIKHDLEIKNKQLQYTIDSLKSQIKKSYQYSDSLKNLKDQIFNLSKGGTILYQRKYHNEIYFIDLKCYSLSINDKDIIKLTPIKDENKWRKMELIGYPSSDNLSLHFYPHDFNGKLIKF